MPLPTTADEILELIRKSGVVEEKRLDVHLDKLRAAGALPGDPNLLTGALVRDGLITNFQAQQFLQGKWRRFTIGKYKVLEQLGSGGMGSVYLCEHMLMRRRVAVKVLPRAKAEDPAALDRFRREARAVGALDHPNLVRAYDIAEDDNLHFLVMEYVDGSSLQEIVKRTGPMDVVRAAHYVRQSALGLQHAWEDHKLVHRDIKPGNILVDRNGIVKVLDMGLARFFNDQDDVLTKKYNEEVLGTADYLAPEQAVDSHEADIRADIYALGCTFYFCLTGKPPFAEGTIAQKLIFHQTRQPRPVRTVRPEIPEGVAAVIEKMMAKAADDRYQMPLEVAEVLTPWTQTPIPPPPDAEMPQLSRAAVGGPPGQSGDGSSASPSPRKSWQISGSTSGLPSASASTIPNPSVPTPAPKLAPPPARPQATPAPRPPAAPPQRTPRPVTPPAKASAPPPDVLPATPAPRPAPKAPAPPAQPPTARPSAPAKAAPPNAAKPPVPPPPPPPPRPAAAANPPAKPPAPAAPAPAAKPAAAVPAAAAAPTVVPSRPAGGSLLQATPVAPRPGTGSQTGVRAAPVGDEIAPWDQLPNNETADAAARADTPRSGRSLGLVAQGEEARKYRKRLYLVMAAVGTGAVLITALILWLVLRNGKPDPNPNGNQPVPPQTGPVVRIVGPGERYSSVKDALAQHRPGDRIVVKGDALREHLEQLVIDEHTSRTWKNVTIESDPEHRVTWRLPSTFASGSAIVLLTDVDGLRLKGFNFDCEKRAQTAITLSCACKEVTFEDLELLNYTDAAIRFNNCEAEEKRPVVLRNVRSSAKNLPSLFFDVLSYYKAHSSNRHVTVEPTCKLGGKIVVKGPNTNLSLPPGVPVERIATPPPKTP